MAQSTLDSNPSSGTATANSQSKILDDDQYTCDLQPISGNVLYCCKELMNFTSVYKRMFDIVVNTRYLYFIFLTFCAIRCNRPLQMASFSDTV